MSDNTENTESVSIRDGLPEAVRTMYDALVEQGSKTGDSLKKVQSFATSDKAIREEIVAKSPKELQALADAQTKAREALEAAQNAYSKHLATLVQKVKSEKGQNDEQKNAADKEHNANVAAYKEMRKGFELVAPMFGLKNGAQILATLPNIGGVRSGNSESAGTRGPNVGGHNYVIDGKDYDASLREIAKELGQDFDAMSAAFFEAAGTTDLKTLPLGTVTTFEHNGLKVEATRVQKAGRPATKSADDTSSATAE